MIARIMVPVRGDGKGDNVLRHAATLAHFHHAHIEVTHCRPRPEDMLPFGVPVPAALREQLIAQSHKLADQEEAGLRAELESLSVELGLSADPFRRGEAATVSFTEEIGRQVDVIQRHGRLADLIAVAKPDRDRNLGTNTLKAALFHSCRPVLMCPPRESPPESLGARVAIAWNGTPEATRAVALSLPIIRMAESALILPAAAEEKAGNTASDLASYLALHRVDAEVIPASAARPSAQSILSDATAQRCDLLIIGAFSDSRDHEALFGGLTQTIVDSSAMPVLFSH